MFGIEIMPISDFTFTAWMIDKINLTFGQFAIKYLLFNLTVILPIGLAIIGNYIYFAMRRQKRIRKKCD
jgi:hypothetical protein